MAALRVMELIQSEEAQFRDSSLHVPTIEVHRENRQTSPQNDTVPSPRWGIGVGFGTVIPFNVNAYRAGPSLLGTIYFKRLLFTELSVRMGFFGNPISAAGHSVSLHVVNVRVLGGIRFRSKMKLQPQFGVFGGWLHIVVQGDNHDATRPAQSDNSDAFQIGVETGLRMRISSLFYGVMTTGVALVTPKTNIEIDDAVVASIGSVMMDCSVSLQIIF
ncbi:MAG: hypothetical protein JXX29_08885 [Deltaproteobacteria bacterium]|nr:hypothetical protein [Deltaproteobacteria bacterium]MBN2671776.1 hypothetical protein [Deltaproteobacteria bacterium]